MTAKCFMVEKTEKCIFDVGAMDPFEDGKVKKPLYRLPDGREVPFGELPIGAMFRKPNGSLVICIPQTPDWGSKTFFCPAEAEDCLAGKGWTVHGEPPNITVSPSIWVQPQSGWHGFIRNGEIVNA